MNAIVWLAVAANLIATAATITTRRRMKRDRANDAAMLAAAAVVVRCAGRGDYLDGHQADEIARELDTAARCALIRGGHLDKEMRAWMRAQRRGQGGADQ